MLIEQRFNQVWVEGEVSNFKDYRSGHWYFTLKDDQAQLRGAMFANRNRLQKFRPKDGDQVLVRGRVSLYEARGDFQIIAEHMELAGEGALRAAMEALVAALRQEGLTDPARKRALPRYPQRVCVITSAGGAALRDVLAVWRRRYPSIEPVLLDVPVQGDAAAPAIIQAVAKANASDAEVILLTRGGGSLEDLWAFNLETVARAVSESRLPVVSAIGHETDHAVTDYVADLRAPTPSAAAELLVPDTAALQVRLQRDAARLLNLARGRIANEARHLERLRQSLGSPLQRVGQQRLRQADLTRRLHRNIAERLSAPRAQLNTLNRLLSTYHPRQHLAQHQERITELGQRLTQATNSKLAQAHGNLGAIARTLHAVGPLPTIERGYAVLTSHDGAALTSIEQTTPGARVHAHVADGRIDLEVVAKQPGEGLVNTEVSPQNQRGPNS